MLGRGLLVALVFLAVSPQREPQFPVHLESLEYPPVARMARITGDVTLAAWPDADGRVTGEPQVLAGHPMLAKAAAQNLKNWRFRSGAQGEVKIAYHFKIDGDGMRGDAPTKCQFDFPDSMTVVTRPPWVKPTYSSGKSGNTE